MCGIHLVLKQLPYLFKNSPLNLRCLQIDGKSLAYTDNMKPYLPLTLRGEAFDTVHRLLHPIGRATAKIVASKYYWPSLCKDVLLSKQCIPCQKSKVHRHNRAQFGNLKTPDNRLDYIHLDLIKLPNIEGSDLCLTTIDRYTRWPVAIPVCDMTAPTVTRALFKNWISIFGAPLEITTD